MTKDEFKDNLNNFNPYTTEQEKNALIQTMESSFTLVKICKILGIEAANELEAEAFIFKLREISVADLIEITHTCKNCGYQDFFNLSIPKMFFKDLVEDYKIIEDIDELDEDFINNKSLTEYNELENNIDETNRKIFDPICELFCKKCGTGFRTKPEVPNIISKYPIKNIFEQYLDISTFTNMTKRDTDTMIPYEREIFLGLIQVKEDKKGS